MPKTSEIGEITGAISDGTTCKSILNSIYSKDSVKILAAEAPGAGV
ncbi:MAG: hypothetical protein LBC61_04805 [Candidatus Peribacteria bacterium]|jgi:hypothetical protein|nr:hypothetical protein [Candidatus Peribacteria bacterium]